MDAAARRNHPHCHAKKIDAELLAKVGQEEEEDVARTRRTLAVLVDMIHDGECKDDEH